MIVLGWDIGGSNTKVCRVEQGRVTRTLARPFEIKDAPADLPQVLRHLADEVAGGVGVVAHAVTMTAELSRNFLTKREGVNCVLDAVELALRDARVHVFTVDGRFVDTAEARRAPLSVAAANWMATASLVSRTYQDALLVDIGTTTTDVIPIAGGRVVAQGHTDPERLSSGELLYTGAVRTPVEALAAEVCVQGRHYAVAAEGFATSADVHLWHGDLSPGDVTGGTADGRPATRACAGARLARALCADRELMDDAAVTALADALAAAQAGRVTAAIARVAARHPSIRHAVVAGVGTFIAGRAAHDAGLDVSRLADDHGAGASHCAPAAAVALLLDERLTGDARTWPAKPGRSRDAIDVVVKVGGSLLADADRLTAALASLDRSSRTLIVPGGGPFANAVRGAYGRGAVNDEAAHWMAVLAMDQYAELLVSRMSRARRVASLIGAREALASGLVPVLAPSHWLREVDPLPHSWDVTSDSIAAWVAGQAGASTLVLVKPAGAAGTLTDTYFDRVVPPGTTCEIVRADDQERLDAAIGIAPPREAENTADGFLDE